MIERLLSFNQDRLRICLILIFSSAFYRNFRQKGGSAACCNRAKGSRLHAFFSEPPESWGVTVAVTPAFAATSCVLWEAIYGNRIAFQEYRYVA